MTVRLTVCSPRKGKAILSWNYADGKVLIFGLYHNELRNSAEVEQFSVHIVF